MTITLTPQQKMELEGKGFSVEMMKNVVQHRRRYWDPRTDGNGNVMGWTQPLPADALRLPHYLRKGFLLEKPQDIQETKVETSTEECICPECGFKAKDSTGLAVHNRRVHNPKRRYRKKKKDN